MSNKKLKAFNAVKQGDSHFNPQLPWRALGRDKITDGAQIVTFVRVEDRDKWLDRQNKNIHVKYFWNNKVMDSYETPITPDVSLVVNF